MTEQIKPTNKMLAEIRRLREQANNTVINHDSTEQSTEFFEEKSGLDWEKLRLDLERADEASIIDDETLKQIDLSEIFPDAGYTA
jgi:hypothetical protein